MQSRAVSILWKQKTKNRNQKTGNKKEKRENSCTYLARLLTRGRTVSMLWPRSSFSPLLHSTRIPRGTPVWHPHCIVQTSKNWPRIKKIKKYCVPPELLVETQKVQTFHLADTLVLQISRLSRKCSDCLETFQIFYKMFRLPGNFPDCLETFQIV